MRRNEAITAVIKNEMKLPLEKVSIVDMVNNIYDDFLNRTCGNCSVVNCEILNAIANTGKIRIVKFGCNKWESNDE